MLGYRRVVTRRLLGHTLGLQAAEEAAEAERCRFRKSADGSRWNPMVDIPIVSHTPVSMYNYV